MFAVPREDGVFERVSGWGNHGIGQAEDIKKSKPERGQR